MVKGMKKEYNDTEQQSYADNYSLKRNFEGS